MSGRRNGHGGRGNSRGTNNNASNRGHGRGANVSGRNDRGNGGSGQSAGVNLPDRGRRGDPAAAPANNRVSRNELALIANPGTFITCKNSLKVSPGPPVPF